MMSEKDNGCDRNIRKDVEPPSGDRQREKLDHPSNFWSSILSIGEDYEIAESLINCSVLKNESFYI